ncbi:MAG: ATPase [Micromonosporaceae bacterium]|nr:ATPase [Micromonosporaceae bacterium]
MVLGGSSVERAETGWDRPSEPAPRWRALLDRALLGRTGEQAPVSGTQIITPRSPATYSPSSYLPPPDYERPELAPPEYGRPGYGRQDYDQRYPGPPDYGPPDYPPAGPGPNGYGPADYERAAYGRGAGYPPQSPYPQPPYPPAIEWRQPHNGAEVDRDVEVLRRDIGQPRVLAFANPKGGVHKTTATVLAAATVGSVRGRGVLAWDDNELRGTLGLRAGSARHARTIRHLVADLAEVESYHGPYLAEQLDQYLRHASDGSYDVLAGEENPRFAQRLDQFTVRRVLELLRRTHEVICVDTGNNVESPNWQTVLQVADQLVLTTVPREDAAFSADWMLDLLEEIGLGHLVANAVTLLSCPTPNPSPLLDDLASHFGARTRAVAVVPYDPTLEAGSSIEYELLQPATKKAWLSAAALMLEPFAR